MKCVIRNSNTSCYNPFVNMYLGMRIDFSEDSAMIETFMIYIYIYIYIVIIKYIIINMYFFEHIVYSLDCIPK